MLYGKQASILKMGMQVPHRFSPKYRRKIIYNQLRADIQQYIWDLCKWKGVEILEGHMMPDHVHPLLSIPPKYCGSGFTRYLKGKTAMMIFERHGNLKYKFGNGHFSDQGFQYAFQNYSP